MICDLYEHPRSALHEQLIKYLCSETGISNTRPTGRMWPAMSVIPARITLQIKKLLTISLGFFPVFCSKCGPQRHHSLNLRAAEHANVALK